MSRTYEAVERKVIPGLDGLTDAGITTIFTRPFQNQSANLVIVDRMLSSSKIRGVYVSLRRSHRYIKDLMRSRGMDPKRMTFIDAVYSISNYDLGEGPLGKNVKLLVCAFSDDFEKDLMTRLRISTARGKGKFLIVDDLFALSAYMGDERFQKFIETFFEGIRRANLTKVIVMADSTTDPELRAALEMASDDFLEIY